MESIFRKLCGLGRHKSFMSASEPSRDQQTADVAIAVQRVNERTEQARAMLAELLKRNDGGFGNVSQL